MSEQDDKETTYKLLTRAIASWLSYKHLTGLGGALKEASLTVPILEFLTRNQKYKIHPEIKHPTFSHGGAGRQRQLDFVAYNAGRGWPFVIETKSLPLKPQEFVDDILRLVLLKKPGTRRFFLVAGELPAHDWGRLKSTRKKTKRKIVGASRVPIQLLINAKGTRKDLVRLFLRDNYREKVVDLKKVSRFAERFLKHFHEEYKLDTMPRKFVTKLISWSRRNRFVAIVWEIKGRQGTPKITFGGTPLSSAPCQPD